MSSYLNAVVAEMGGLTADEKLLLWVLAEGANDEGWGVRPPVGELEGKSGMIQEELLEILGRLASHEGTIHYFDALEVQVPQVDGSFKDMAVYRLKVQEMAMNAMEHRMKRLK